jgi:ubiquinone/menaquinone biosynthesis C-methylase UbiE
MIWSQDIQSYFQARRHKRLVSLFYIPKNANVLDVSCGGGDLLSILHKYLGISTAHGIDISEKNIRKAKASHPWGTFHIASADSLPYKNERFETVLSCMSLHHYKKPQEIFSEISRVLSPEGTFYLVDLIPGHRWSQIFNNWGGCPEPYHFEKYYLKEEIVSLAQSAGLRLETDKATRPYSNIRIVTIKKASAT